MKLLPAAPPKARSPAWRTRPSILGHVGDGVLKGLERAGHPPAKGAVGCRRVLFTARHCQLVSVVLGPGEVIGAEVHPLDQYFRVEEGTGVAVLAGARSDIRAGFAMLVPAGTRHNIVNTGGVPLKLYGLLSPATSPARTGS
jgi:mannose-6-phosphate isomerase-like protein (cupin superfamily)